MGRKWKIFREGRGMSQRWTLGALELWWSQAFYWALLAQSFASFMSPNRC